MSDNQSSKATLDELNKQVHQLNYIKPESSEMPKINTNRKQGQELAKKIQKNIEAYRNEVNTSQRPSLQT